MASHAEKHGDRLRAGHSSRRDVLRRLIQLGVAASLTDRASFAQTLSDTRRLDLHHHYFASTPLLKKVMANAVFPQPIFGYTPAQSLEAMDRAGVATAFLSAPYRLATIL